MVRTFFHAALLSATFLSAEPARAGSRGVVQRFGPHRLTGFAAAEGDGVRSRWVGAEVVVEAHHPVHLGDGLRDALDPRRVM